jgi:glycosyltransferase involved in cell wall biosynthesis
MKSLFTAKKRNRCNCLRVLAIAEAANPDWTSVPLIGWELTNALRDVANVHLVTQCRNRSAIESRGWRHGIEFTAIDNEKFAAPLFKLASLLRGGQGKGWTTLSAFSAISYYSFEREVWRLFAPRIIGGEFDIVHRITPLSPTCQSTLAKRCSAAGIPFVIGPLNGGVPWPAGFRRRRHEEKEWLSYIRGLYKLMPAYRSTRINSSAIIVGSEFTRSDQPPSVQAKCVYIPENGINPRLFGTTRSKKASFPLKAIFIGRLVPYKGADIFIRAAEKFVRAGKMTLEILGDGPQNNHLVELISSLNLEKNIHLRGWVSHDKIQDILVTSDIMCLPSIREFGGGVILEAMAVGVTPIVANYGGPAELLDDACGFRVPFTNENDLVEGFARVFEKILETPSKLDELGENAWKRVQDNFTWAKKASQIASVYTAVLDGLNDLRHLSLPHG